VTAIEPGQRRCVFGDPKKNEGGCAHGTSCSRGPGGGNPTARSGRCSDQSGSCAVCSSDVKLMGKPGCNTLREFHPGPRICRTVVALGRPWTSSGPETVSLSKLTRCLRRRNWIRITRGVSITGKGHRANGFTTMEAMPSTSIMQHGPPIPDSVGLDEASLITNLGCVLYGFETSEDHRR
jgi:hypothetical protein